MGDIDCDDFGIESAMRLATRIRWVNSRTVPYMPVDADDCAPGLDYPPILGLSIAAVIDHDGRVVHEVRIDEEPVYDTLLWCEIPDAAHELEGFGHHEAATALLLRLDVDRDDRPSPGDNITREAFDAMDGYRRSNDSGGGGTP